MQRRSWPEWFSDRAADRRDTKPAPLRFDTQRGVEPKAHMANPGSK